MWENAITYYGNYSPTGDVLVSATCIVFFILMKVSYISRNKTYKIFRMMVIELLVFTYLKVAFYIALNMMMTKKNIPPMFLIFLHSSYRIGIYALLFSFTRYLQGPLHIDPRISRAHVKFLSISLAVFSILTLTEMFTSWGLNIEIVDGEYYVSTGFDIFPIAYVYMLFFVYFSVFFYRHRIYKQIITGFSLTCLFSFVFMCVQLFFHQTSYTMASFLFPLYALLYLIHSSPYDVEIGTLNEKEFHKKLLETNKPTLLVEIYIHSIAKNRDDYPEGLRIFIRDTFSKYFKQTLIFQIASGNIVLTAENFGTYQTSIDDFFDQIKKECNKSGLNVKCVVINTKLLKTNKDDCLKIMRFIGRQMEENEVHVVTEKEVAEYENQKQLITTLENIVTSNNLDDDRVSVFCQPVFNIRTQKFDTGEALMRLRLNGEYIQPGSFIPLAEKIGAVNFLGEIIFNKTCLAIKSFIDRGYDLRRISVNFTVSDFKKKDFCQVVLGLIAKAGIPCEKVAIEMTETQNEKDFLAVKEKMLYLKDYGIKFYLDDFGTGYSNYERIMELPFDIVKFDRSLVLASSASEKSGKMVTNMANMFHDTDYAVLYEGVETEADVNKCIKMNAEYLQGFHYSKPIPIQDMTKFLSKSEV